ncbi:endonuclease [Loktanella sp. 3ANDIMAR09]|uniref:endonuclease n=1 Tax=Loktanella sp. 3ANDIMAR09 TaxID=1225657 RepID=UPI000B21D26D|nr:endonuclease [Loktanella sp. 3ANDIMAR09]
MKTTAPKELGILVVAGVFGLIAGGVALAVFGTGFIAALFIAGLVAVIVAVVLWLGWREPAGRNTQPGYTAKGEPIGADAAARAAGAAAHGVGHAPATTAASATVAAGATDASGSQGSAATAQTAGTSGTAETKAVSATPANESAAASAPKAGTSAAGDPNARTVHAGAGAAGGIASEVSGDTGASVVEAKPAAAAPVKAKPGKPGTASVEAAPSDADKPKLLDQAREGGPDNLKEIKGVGPKMETMLHGMGIYHFDQVASWTDKELAWVDSNLEGFKGRASRDNWVSQAKILAAGGETEFSKKVDKGGVY